MHLDAVGPADETPETPRHAEGQAGAFLKKFSQADLYPHGDRRIEGEFVATGARRAATMKEGVFFRRSLRAPCTASLVALNEIIRLQLPQQHGLACRLSPLVLIAPPIVVQSPGPS